MKAFDTIYMTINNREICFPKEIRYYDRGYYTCKSPTGKLYYAEEWHVFKISANFFATIVDKIHSCIYDEKTDTFDLYNMLKVKYTFSIKPNGQIVCGDYKCVVYCPRNCLKWTDVALVSYGDDSYALKACDDNGKTSVKQPKKINPYSNNCSEVYKMIENNPSISTTELIEKMQWASNRVTSRLSELLASGMIRADGRVFNEDTRRYVSTWVTTGKR